VGCAATTLRIATDNRASRGSFCNRTSTFLEPQMAAIASPASHAIGALEPKDRHTKMRRSQARCRAEQGVAYSPFCASTAQRKSGSMAPASSAFLVTGFNGSSLPVQYNAGGLAVNSL